MESKRSGKASPSSSSSSSSSSSLADVIFGKKEEVGSHDHGYFCGVFSPPSTVTRKDSNRTGNARSGTADTKTQASPSKCQSTQLCNDGKPIDSADTTESPYFGSSVHYGCRDFYTCSPPKNTTETTSIPKNSEEEGPDSSNYATRGNWWQGSLYY